MTDTEIELEMLRNEVEFLRKENDLLRSHYKELLNLIRNKIYGNT